MTDTIWILEYRTRQRKDGKWSAWMPCEPPGRVVETYREFPTMAVIAHEKYERRAVEFVRKCGQEQKG